MPVWLTASLCLRGRPVHGFDHAFSREVLATCPTQNFMLSIKRLPRPGLGFKSFVTATPTIASYDGMAMIRKGQVVGAPANDVVAQRDFIATLFGAAV